MILYIIIILICAVSCVFFSKKRPINLNYDHFLITGGSSGIGLAIAIEAVKLGANVTIIARSKVRLEEAKRILCSEIIRSNQKILSFSADVCEQSDRLTEIIKEVEYNGGPITVLINCAGTSVCHRFEDTPIEDFSKMMNVNYLGSVNMTYAVLPLMKQRKHGKIVFISSLAGLIGLFGYTAYSASKFALFGLAQALQMEVKPYNISVTVSFPPDTDTPGFAEEIKDKPTETMRMSESGGLFSAKQVALKTLQATFNKKFMTSVGFEGWILCTLGSGTAPVNSVLELIMQMGCCTQNRHQDVWKVEEKVFVTAWFGDDFGCFCNFELAFIYQCVAIILALIVSVIACGCSERYLIEDVLSSLIS